MPAGLSSANGYEAWEIEFWSKKVAKSGSVGSLFGVWEGLGTPLETSWRHGVLLYGPLGGLGTPLETSWRHGVLPWGVLGSILGALGTPLGLVTFGWPFGAKVDQK